MSGGEESDRLKKNGEERRERNEQNCNYTGIKSDDGLKNIVKRNWERNTRSFLWMMEAMKSIDRFFMTWRKNLFFCVTEKTEEKVSD